MKQEIKTEPQRIKAAKFRLENQKKQLKNTMETQQKAIQPEDYDRKNPERIQKEQDAENDK